MLRMIGAACSSPPLNVGCIQRRQEPTRLSASAGTPYNPQVLSTPFALPHADSGTRDDEASISTCILALLCTDFAFEKFASGGLLDSIFILRKLTRTFQRCAKAGGSG